LVNINFDILGIGFNGKRTSENKNPPLGVKTVSQGIKYDQRSGSEEKHH